VGALLSFGNDLFLWDTKKDSSTSKFVVEVSLALVDEDGLALFCTGEVVKSSLTVGTEVKLSCEGTIRANTFEVGAFQPPAAAFDWTCRDTGSSGKFRQPKVKSEFSYDLSGFKVVDDFLLADAKETKKGKPAKAVIRFRKTTKKP
jgi:hypothetical protein